MIPHVHVHRYWPVIDDALRAAAYDRGVTVRLMGSYWNHTDSDMLSFLTSLSSNSGTGSGGRVETVSEMMSAESVCNVFHRYPVSCLCRSSLLSLQLRTRTFLSLE